eukprot:XP_001689629.1 predicted protein [Chlamydomonas reinhardtii]
MATCCGLSGAARQVPNAVSLCESLVISQALSCGSRPQPHAKSFAVRYSGWRERVSRLDGSQGILGAVMRHDRCTHHFVGRVGVALCRICMSCSEEEDASRNKVTDWAAWAVVTVYKAAKWRATTMRVAMDGHITIPRCPHPTKRSAYCELRPLHGRWAIVWCVQGSYLVLGVMSSSRQNGRVATVVCLGTWRFGGFSIGIRTKPAPNPGQQSPAPDIRPREECLGNGQSG